MPGLDPAKVCAHAPGAPRAACAAAVGGEGGDAGQAPGRPPPAATVGMCLLSGQLTAALQRPMGSPLFSFSPPPGRSRLQEMRVLRGAHQGAGRGAEDVPLIIQMP